MVADLSSPPLDSARGSRCGRLVMVEDHGLFAETVSLALAAEGYHVTVVDVTGVDDVPAAVRATSPDAILLDLDLGDGRSSLPTVEPLSACAPVAMITGVTDVHELARCVRAGAVGVIDKQAGFDDLLEAVARLVTEGAILTTHDREEHLARLRCHEESERRRLAPFDRLSSREAEVLAALMEGRTVDDIASEGVVATSTVRTQVRAILTKLGVHSQMAAVAMARRSRWSLVRA